MPNEAQPGLVQEEKLDEPTARLRVRQAAKILHWNQLLAT